MKKGDYYKIRNVLNLIELGEFEGTAMLVCCIEKLDNRTQFWKILFDNDLTTYYERYVYIYDIIVIH